MDHLLITHSIVRWLVLLFGLYAITKSARGLLKNQDYTKQHNLSRILFVSVIHFQAFLGVVLYFSKGWFNNLGAAFADMGNQVTRFWAIEHMFGMIAAVVWFKWEAQKARKQQKLKISTE